MKNAFSDISACTFDHSLRGAMIRLLEAIG